MPPTASAATPAVTAAATAPTAPAGRLLRGLRYAGLAWLLIQGVLTTLLLYPLVGHARRKRLRGRWSRRMLALLGIDLQLDGDAIAPGCLLVANHISWLDVFVINAAAPAAFVSKSEVRGWPLIGWLAARNDTVFLMRGSRGHARIINTQIAEKLDAGHNVAIFPEGTTTDGTHVQHFHAALLQPAIAAQRPVQAIALRYHTHAGHYSAAPAYAGDTTLLQSLAAIVAERSTVATLHVDPPVTTVSAERRTLAADLHGRIASHIAAYSGPRPTARAAHIENNSLS